MEGRLRSRSWETQDGQKRSTIEVIANNVQFLRGAQKERQPLPSADKETPNEVREDEVSSIDLDNAEPRQKGSEEIPF